MSMLAPITHILALTTIHRDRMLPTKGRLIARKGQKVNPNDVVAETIINPDHIILDVSRGLGLPDEEADQTIHRQPGNEVEAGDVIAGPVGLGRRVVRSPKPGKVLVAGSGQVLLEMSSKPMELKAGFSGTVSELFPDRGVQIETTGVLIQCFWGNGRIDTGVLTVLAHSPDEEITADRLDISLRGTVVFAGTCENADVFKVADELPLRGLILGSMSSVLISDALRVRFPVVVVEGFGKIPLNSVAYKLLSTSEKRETSVYAILREPYTGNRPEIVIPLPAAGLPATPSEIMQYSSGQQVRALRIPYRSMVGTIISIEPDLVTLPSGINAPAALVHLENGENVVIPLVNLEILV